MASTSDHGDIVSEIDPSPNLPRTVPFLSHRKPHTFIIPSKRIHEGHDVPHFLTSHAYTSIGTWIAQLNLAMCPRLSTTGSQTQTWPLNSPAFKISEPVQKVRDTLDAICAIIEEAPPDTGPRRFGNVAFRVWFGILEERVDDLLERCLSEQILDAGKETKEEERATAKDELRSYLLGAFGNAQRLDYGTGHELSFLAFLGCIWMLGGFTNTEYSEGDGEREGALERSIVIGIFEPYLQVVRKLILTYSLEPAGSHGVWGLDDHAFLPYVFGSAQFCPAIRDGDSMPVEGSLAQAPDPGGVAKREVVESQRAKNMYFAAVGFIYDVKSGPFWEHSPILFDISGIRTGWGKINKGMIKMYNAEVLSKFPVVQHFPFGSLFSWETDPTAPTPIASTHVASQPASHTVSITGDTGGAPQTRPPQEGSRAPWATQPSSEMPIATPAPWAAQPSSGAHIATAPSWVKTSTRAQQPQGLPPTKAPWAASGAAGGGIPARFPPSQPRAPAVVTGGGGRPMKAPWAKDLDDSKGR